MVIIQEYESELRRKEEEAAREEDRITRLHIQRRSVLI